MPEQTVRDPKTGRWVFVSSDNPLSPEQLAAELTLASNRIGQGQLGELSYDRPELGRVSVRVGETMNPPAPRAPMQKLAPTPGAGDVRLAEARETPARRQTERKQLPSSTDPVKPVSMADVRLADYADERRRKDLAGEYDAIAPIAGMNPIDPNSTTSKLRRSLTGAVVGPALGAVEAGKLGLSFFAPGAAGRFRDNVDRLTDMAVGSIPFNKQLSAGGRAVMEGKPEQALPAAKAALADEWDNDPITVLANAWQLALPAAKLGGRGLQSAVSSPKVQGALTRLSELEGPGRTNVAEGMKPGQMVLGSTGGGSVPQNPLQAARGAAQVGAARVARRLMDHGTPEQVAPLLEREPQGALGVLTPAAMHTSAGNPKRMILTEADRERVGYYVPRRGAASTLWGKHFLRGGVFGPTQSEYHGRVGWMTRGASKASQITNKVAPEGALLLPFLNKVDNAFGNPKFLEVYLDELDDAVTAGEIRLSAVNAAIRQAGRTLAPLRGLNVKTVADMRRVLPALPFEAVRPVVRFLGDVKKGGGRREAPRFNLIDPYEILPGYNDPALHDMPDFALPAAMDLTGGMRHMSASELSAQAGVSIPDHFAYGILHPGNFSGILPHNLNALEYIRDIAPDLRDYRPTTSGLFLRRAVPYAETPSGGRLITPETIADAMRALEEQTYGAQLGNNYGRGAGSNIGRGDLSDVRGGVREVLGGSDSLLGSRRSQAGDLSGNAGADERGVGSGVGGGGAGGRGPGVSDASGSTGGGGAAPRTDPSSGSSGPGGSNSGSGGSNSGPGGQLTLGALGGGVVPTRQQVSELASRLTGNRDFNYLDRFRSPLSINDGQGNTLIPGSYERLAGNLGKQASDALRTMQLAIEEGTASKGQALRSAKASLEYLYPALEGAGFPGLVEELKRHVADIETDLYRSAARRSRDPKLTEAERLAAAEQAKRLEGSAKPYEEAFGRLATTVLGDKIPDPQFALRGLVDRVASVNSILKLKYNIKSSAVNLVQPLETLWPRVSSADYAKIVAESLNPKTRKRLEELGVLEGPTKIESDLASGRKAFADPELAAQIDLDSELMDLANLLESEWAIRKEQGELPSVLPPPVRIPKTLKEKLKEASPFSSASAQNRMIGYLYGELDAKRRGMTDPVEVHRNGLAWAEIVEFDNSTYNMPPVMRDTMARLLLQYKGFTVKSLENVGSLVSSAKSPAEAAARLSKWGAQKGAVGGVKALSGPMSALLGGVYFYTRQRAKDQGASDEEAQRIAEAAFFGAPALLGMDLSGSVTTLDEPFGDSVQEQATNFLAGPTVGAGLSLMQMRRDGRSALDMASQLSPYIKQGRAIFDGATGKAETRTPRGTLGGPTRPGGPGAPKGIRRATPQETVLRSLAVPLSTSSAARLEKEDLDQLQGRLAELMLDLQGDKLAGLSKSSQNLARYKVEGMAKRVKDRQSALKMIQQLEQKLAAKRAPTLDSYRG